MAEPLLEIDGLSKSFGAVVASDGITLELGTGELRAVIGPNGAGKTTLIGQLAGEIRPDAGTIRFAGKDITRQPAHARAAHGLARSFQVTSLFPNFTALENVAIAAQARTGHSFAFWQPVSRDAGLNEAAERVLDQVGLAARAHTRAGALAHGEQRQLEIAMALACRPKLLLLDEPTAGMGQEDSVQMVTLLSGLKGHVTMLLVEHDMDAVFALADRISVLVYGRVIATGPPEDVRNDPEVRRAYLGEDL